MPGNGPSGRAWSKPIVVGRVRSRSRRRSGLDLEEVDKRRMRYIEAASCANKPTTSSGKRLGGGSTVLARREVSARAGRLEGGFRSAESIAAPLSPGPSGRTETLLQRKERRGSVGRAGARSESLAREACTGLEPLWPPPQVALVDSLRRARPVCSPASSRARSSSSSPESLEKRGERLII